jgi:hypothetical protein
MIEVPPSETLLPLILHSSLQLCYYNLAFGPREVLITIHIRTQHDVGPQERFAVPLDRIVEGHIPGIELEARLAAEALAGRLQLGAREGRDGFAGDRAGQGVSEVALATALAIAKTAVQQP